MTHYPPKPVHISHHDDKLIVNVPENLYFPEVTIHCARKRNHHWQHERTTTTDPGIRIPAGITPYPPRTDRIADIPRVDPGHNFGCLARYGIMDEYVHTMLQEIVSGIPAGRWLQFFQGRERQ